MSVVHVAVAVIVKTATQFYDRQILISKRPDDVHQGGLWEFPGGKVEDDENVVDALARELDEELGIQIDKQAHSLEPLIEIHHDYGDKQVFLDVWLVSDFSGKPNGREGQPVRWVSLSQLDSYDFPAANKPILNACRLPRSYGITPTYTSLAQAKENIQFLVNQGLQLILFRQPQLSESEYLAWADDLISLCQDQNVKLLASGSLELLRQHDFAGLQLPWREAQVLTERPISQDLLLAVSCHDETELALAESIGADFVTLSPVQPTNSHPDAEPLGWKRFSQIVHQAKLPVYALGGLGSDTHEKALGEGAQGLAGIHIWQA